VTQRLITIGGIGGSGTRAVIRVLRQAGAYIGANLNRAMDNFDFQRHFMVEWLRPTLDHWVGRGPEPDVAAANRSFGHFMEIHVGRTERDPDVVAWKHPRTIYCLPTLHRIRPDLRFIHLVRDGRDMVLSANQHQRDDLGPILLSPQEQQLSLQVQSQLVWARGNALVADFAEREMGGSYLQIRFEDLCFEPARMIGEILELAGLGEVDEELMSEVSVPRSIGRWRQQELEPPVPEFDEALRRFGYAGAEWRRPDEHDEAGAAAPVAVTTATVDPRPLVVGGYHKYAPGIVARVLRLGHRFMGARHLDRDLVAADFTALIGIAQGVLAARLSGEAVPTSGLERRMGWFLSRHFEGVPPAGRSWGFASPRALDLLPALDALMPEMRFVHVVVDPRTRPDGMSPVPPWATAAARQAHWTGFDGARWLEFWSYLNLETLLYGEEAMGERYLRVRVEDLAADPGAWIDRITRFAGHGPATAEMVSEMWLEPPERRHDPEIAPGSLVAEALDAFGY
jgi:hypothetical protein